MTTIHITLQSGKSIELTPEEAQELRGKLEALLLKPEPNKDLLKELQKEYDKQKPTAPNHSWDWTTPKPPSDYWVVPLDHIRGSDCAHMSCSECHGTGIKANGSMCVHMISCPCRRCSPACMSC